MVVVYSGLRNLCGCASSNHADALSCWLDSLGSNMGQVNEISEIFKEFDVMEVIIG